jgi:hypothetical protein
VLNNKKSKQKIKTYTTKLLERGGKVHPGIPGKEIFSSGKGEPKHCPPRKLIMTAYT